MRDKSHEDQVERHAKFVKEHDRSEWKPQLTKFTNAQIEKANKFYKELSKTEKGKEKIKKLKGRKA